MENRIQGKSKTYDLVLTGIFAALIFVVTYATHFPFPTMGIGPKILVHLGDAALYLSVIMIGTRRGTIASAIGMGLFDILSQYIIWAPVTIIAKAGMAFIAGLFINGNKREGKSVKFNIIGGIIAGIYMIFMYWIGGAIITMLTTKNVGIVASLIANTEGIPGNIIQVVLGIVVAVPLGAAINKVKKK